MRNLVCIEANEKGSDVFYVISTNGELKKLNKQEVVSEIKQGGAHLIDNLYLDGSELKIRNESKLRADVSKNIISPAYTLAVYVEGKKPRTKHVGYRAFNPVTKEIAVMTRNAYASLVKRYGCLNGELKDVGVTNPTKLVIGKVKEIPADKYVGVYLKTYHSLKHFLKTQGEPSDKIVRTTVKDLELRRIAPGSYERYTTHKGVTTLNVKRWYMDEFRRVFMHAGYHIEQLELGEDVRDIEINLPKSNLDEISEYLSCMGAFSDVGLEELTIKSKKLSRVMDYAFYSNKLRVLSVPASVVELGKHCFGKNQLSTLLFERRVNKNEVLSIGDYCFADNKIQGEVFLPNISYLGKGAFKNNPITKLIFSRGSTFEAITYGSLSGTKLEILFVPDSVKRIESGSLTNTPIKRLVFGKGSKIEYIAPDCVDNIRGVCITGTYVKPAFKSGY